MTLWSKSTPEHPSGRPSFFAASFWHFPVPSCSHTCACWLHEPLTQQEWCASTFSSWILLVHERFSLSALTGWCQANHISSSAPLSFNENKAIPPTLWDALFYTDYTEILSYEVITVYNPLKLHYESSCSNKYLAVTYANALSQESSQAQRVPFAEHVKVCAETACFFFVWVYPKRNLPSKKSIMLLYLDIDIVFLTGFLGCANTNSNQRSYWSRKINFDQLLPEIPSYSKSVGCHAVRVICLICDAQQQLLLAS